MTIARYHAIERTSPFGQKFIGTCYQCRLSGLPMSAALEVCENIAGLTEEESMAMAIEGQPAIRSSPDPGKGG